MGQGCRVDGPALGRGRSTEGQHARHIDDGSLTSGHHSRDGGPGQQCGRNDLHVHNLTRLLSWECGEGHVVRHASIVDEHIEVLAGTYVGHFLGPGIGAEVSDQGPDADVGKCGHEFFESLQATPDNDEVVPLGPEPTGESLTDAG